MAGSYSMPQAWCRPRGCQPDANAFPAAEQPLNAQLPVDLLFYLPPLPAALALGHACPARLGSDGVALPCRQDVIHARNQVEAGWRWRDGRRGTHRGLPAGFEQPAQGDGALVNFRLEDERPTVAGADDALAFDPQ
jgi:hypothetical protein